MSIINTGLLRDLYNDASVHDEWATTKLWEYLFNKKYFSDDEWIVASQQPPSRAYPSLRRVDLIIQYHPLGNRVWETVLFLEAKRNAARETDIAECETQAWRAGLEIHSTEGQRPVWFMTAIGPTFRVWIYDPATDLPVPVLPGCLGIDHEDDYLDIDNAENSKALREAFRSIKRHHIPPQKFLAHSTPIVSSDQGGSSSPPAPPLEVLASAAKAPIPLAENSWIYAHTVQSDESSVTSRLASGAELTSLPTDWQPQYKDNIPCLTYITPGRNVFWTYTLDPSPFESRQSAYGKQPMQYAGTTSQQPDDLGLAASFSSDDDIPIPDIGGGSSAIAKGERPAKRPKEQRPIKEVKVKVEEHSLSKDEYQFRTVRGEIKKVPWPEWKLRDLGFDSKVVSWKGNKYIYYTFQKLRHS